jgi:hypothetical protein
MPYPFGYAIFCDDIRSEIGEKKSYIGVYRNTMFIRGDFPFVVPKFAIEIFYIEEFSKHPKKVDVNVYLPGEDLNHPSLQRELVFGKNFQRVPRTPDVESDWKKILRTSTQFILAPLVLQKPGSIRIRVKRGNKDIRIGRLVIQREASDQ